MKNKGITTMKGAPTSIKKSLTKEGLAFLKKTGKMPTTYGIEDERSGQLPEGRF